MKIQIVCLIISVCAVAGWSQSVKTASARELAAVDLQIFTTQAEIERMTRSVAVLQGEFRPGALELKFVNDELKGLNGVLTLLQKRKSELEKLPLKTPLPSNDTGLLKLLVMQNERIIDLLEQLVRTK